MRGMTPWEGRTKLGGSRRSRGWQERNATEVGNDGEEGGRQRADLRDSRGGICDLEDRGGEDGGTGRSGASWATGGEGR